MRRSRWLEFGRSAPLIASERRRPESSVREGRARLLVFGLFVAMLVPTLALGMVMGRPAILLAAPTIVGMIVWRDQPTLVAAMMILGGMIARVVLLGTGDMTDQVETTQAALQLVLTGGNPYGHGIVGTSTGAPFPYGPLALFAYVPGIWMEIAAAVATMVVLLGYRAFATLAVYAACPLIVRATIMGLNDVLPAFLILVALLAVRRSAIGGAIVLAFATAVKPYAVAWAPSIVGLGGLPAVVTFLIASAALWSPLLAWGPEMYVRSVTTALDAHPVRENGLGMPGLRLLTLPLGLMALLTRSWRASALLGVAIFLLLGCTGNWLSYGYLIPPLLVLGVALESPVLGDRADPVSLQGPARASQQPLSP